MIDGLTSTAEESKYEGLMSSANQIAWMDNHLRQRKNCHPMPPSYICWQPDSHSRESPGGEARPFEDSYGRIGLSSFPEKMTLLWHVKSSLLRILFLLASLFSSLCISLVLSLYLLDVSLQ